MRLALLLIVTLLTGCGGGASTQVQSESRFEKVLVAGEDHKNGIFDISLEYGADGIGWLAYSRVEVPQHVETHLAKSTDRGASWTYAGTVNRSTAGSLAVAGRTYTGVWRYETPTLLYDAQDAPAKRWKLFWQRYLSVPPHKESNRLFASGWIEYAYAATPEGPWSSPMCLFGKRENNCRVDPKELAPELAQDVFYNELGSIAVGGTLYLSMDASTTASGFGEWDKRRIVLLASADHGATWRYAGTLTTYDDAKVLGYLVLTGSSLVAEGGRLFLLVTPSGAMRQASGNRGHDGTLSIEFEDIARARLKRDASGKLIVLRHIKPDLHSGGLSDHDQQNTRGGVMLSQINLRARGDFFQVFNTGQSVTRP